MCAKNRRTEKNQLLAVEKLLDENNYQIKNIINIGKQSEDKLFLEGTGSLILDHDNKYFYVAESIRSNPIQLNNFIDIRGYKKGVLFQAKSSNQKNIYHTNVIMSVAEKFSVVCFECIRNENERDLLRNTLLESKEIIEITLEQMEKSFCGNVLQVKSIDDNPITIMSKIAYLGFTKE